MGFTLIFVWVPRISLTRNALDKNSTFYQTLKLCTWNIQQLPLLLSADFGENRVINPRKLSEVADHIHVKFPDHHMDFDKVRVLDKDIRRRPSYIQQSIPELSLNKTEAPPTVLDPNSVKILLFTTRVEARKCIKAILGDHMVKAVSISIKFEISEFWLSSHVETKSLRVWKDEPSLYH